MGLQASKATTPYRILPGYWFIVAWSWFELPFSSFFRGCSCFYLWSGLRTLVFLSLGIQWLRIVRVPGRADSHHADHASVAGKSTLTAPTANLLKNMSIPLWYHKRTHRSNSVSRTDFLFMSYYNNCTLYNTIWDAQWEFSLRCTWYSHIKWFEEIVQFFRTW